MLLFDWFKPRATSIPDRYARAMSLIARKAKVKVRPASKQELTQLASIGVREPILGLYSSCVVSGEAWTRMRAAIQAPESILSECVDAYPGCVVAPLGFIVIATTGCGDTFALDFNHVDQQGHPPVLFVSHDRNWSSNSPEEIAKACPRVADSLVEFLELSLKPSKILY